MALNAIRYAFMAYLVCSVGAQENWMEELLNNENEKREIHGSPPLQLSEQLTAGAQEWADHLAELCQWKGDPHAPKDPEQAPGLFVDGVPAGENIHKGRISGSMDIKEWAPKNAPTAAENWYSEIEKYPFGDYDGVTSVAPGTFHFSQQVWKETKDVGYGLATCNDNTFFLVARYFPPGNHGSRSRNTYKENVLPPRY